MILFTVCNMNTTDCYCMVIETFRGNGIITYHRRWFLSTGAYRDNSDKMGA